MLTRADLDLAPRLDAALALRHRLERLERRQRVLGWLMVGSLALNVALAMTVLRVLQAAGLWPLS